MQDGKCRNVNGHGIYGAIVVTAGPRGSLGAHVSHDACMDLVKQVCRCTSRSDTLILRSGTNTMWCIRSRTSAYAVVILDHSSPTLTTTEVIGSEPI